MKINSIDNIEIVSFVIAGDGKSLSGTCRVDASYDDGVSISDSIGNDFQMHAFVLEDGVVMSRADKMINGGEFDVIWAAVSDLSKSTLSENLK